VDSYDHLVDVEPLAPGACTARITDEAGNTLSAPIVVR
jgi:hypothetical protein